MSAAKLVLDEELGQLADMRGPTSAEAYVLSELREARSAGEGVFAFRDSGSLHTRTDASTDHQLGAFTTQAANPLGPASMSSASERGRGQWWRASSRGNDAWPKGVPNEVDSNPD
jgi:hypothetical protein